MGDPYLAVSLDAVNHAADLGRASGLTEEAAGWGLVRMWAHAFRSKVDVVTPAQVSGFFGGDVARVAVALMAFGFLEAVGDNFRVKGADRYLRLHEARRKGGLAAAKHLVPGARQRKKSLGSSPEAAQRQPEVQPGLLSALSPNTEHRTPNKKKLRAAGAAPRTGWQALVDEIVAIYRRIRGAPYIFNGQDAKALGLLWDAVGGDVERIKAMWERALRHVGFPTTASVPELWANRNHFQGAAPAQTPARRPTGAATAADTNWSNYDGPEVSGG